MAEQKFEVNEDGNIVAWPVTGWVAAVVSETAVILKIEYLESSQGTDNAAYVQLHLTAQQTLGLAETLQKQARRLLQTRTPPGHLPS